jgi:hypothetical protein
MQKAEQNISTDISHLFVDPRLLSRKAWYQTRRDQIRLSLKTYVQIPGATFLAACSSKTSVDPESRGFFSKTPNGTSCGMVANIHVSIALRLRTHQPTHREIIVFGTVRSTNLSAIAIACLN